MNSLVNDFTTEKSTVGETTEKAEQFSIPSDHKSNKENHFSSLDETNLKNFTELDSDNVIDTYDDVFANPSKQQTHVDLEATEDPPCKLIEPSPTSYTSNFPLSNAKSVDNELTTTVGTTTEPPKADTSDIHVEGLNVEDTYQPDSLTVSWKKPNSSLDGIYYRVRWELDTTKSACKVETKAETYKIILPRLKPCRTYEVTVTPYIGNDTGDGRVGRGTTGFNVSNDALDFKILNKTDNSLKISWSMPGTDCVANYLINVCHNDDCFPEANTTTTTFTKEDLNPCWNYSFNLTVFGPRGPYGSASVNDTTEFVTPGQPSPPTIDSGNHTLNVTWNQTIGHTCVDHYRVSWIRNHVNETKKTNETSIILRGLEACAVYEIVISAVWHGGESEERRAYSNATAPDVTDAPVPFEKPSAGNDTISIWWRIPTNESNNCHSMTLIVLCTVNKTLGQGYDSHEASQYFTIEHGIVNAKKYTTVGNVGPYTRYICHGATLNAGGRSREISSPVTVTTLQSVPTAPILKPAEETTITNTSIELKWDKPKIVPGVLTRFIIAIIRHYTILHSPAGCVEPTDSVENITIDDGNATSHLLDAVPMTLYRIRMYAATEAGFGSPSASEESYTTPAGAPSQVTNVTYMISSTPDPNLLDVTIMWGPPCLANSKVIEHYQVIGTGRREGFEEHTFNYTAYQTTNCVNNSCALMIDSLKEEFTYDVEIATKVADYDYLGDVSQLTIPFPAGIPPQPNENYTRLISIDPLKARRSTTTATVLLPIFPNTGGTIQCYAIIVAKRKFNDNETFGRFDEPSNCENALQPHIATWSESKREHFTIPYQAVKFGADCYFSYVADYGSLKAVKFVLGEDTETCPEISSNQEERSYCNGPLDPDTWYDVRMRAFTSGGYRDSVIFTVKTDAELQVGLVIGTIFGILFLGILTTMMLLVRKCSLQVVLRRFLHSDMTGSPVPAPFTRRKFIAHCQQLADNPGKLSNEYQLLQTLSVDLQMPTNAACLQANRKKNRYTDILPYDFSRVKLEVIDNDPNTDYINASFIKGFSGDEDYIACQGPKEETTYDFWRMIDQYDVKIIVMLTQLVEKNKEKCHQYFPTIRETFTYENMAIRCTSELDYKTYTQRTLILQKENEKRTIIHLHFKDWPDHDVPEDFDPMINFCQIMRRHMGVNRGLVVVHCSAGIGRTGTLIAIDILLQHIKENRKLDVFGTVYRLRHHRINMVQRESQYAYIYNCIKQVLKNPYFSKTYKPPSVDPIFDNNSHKKKETSDSNTNLVSSLETLKKSSFSTSVESADPIHTPSSKLASRTCYPFNGLRCAKSTSAIDTRPCPKLIGRSNTHDHPIYDISIDSPEVKSSDISFDITESEGSTTSLYENMQPLLRSKSTHAFGRGEDSCVIQNLLEHDTSL
ncbi:receptor-type tyrosine-protein phosphatase H [Venturia canescens]|uniref:receptor-type tyrosine-protein phosphatase H n=1 Tax=Venturia canescens TaxID=32260 RepID=UPI001C9C023B|nr:receptor-type tyrosine-protein phosphatase H [Venturia canescens]